MHNKPIVKCPNCNSSDIYMNKLLCKCSECSTIFLISDKTRAFACSDYEKTFQDRYVQQYRGYNIYEYKSPFNDNLQCIMVETLDDCYELIDETIEQIEYTKKTEDIEEVKAYMYSGNIYRTIELALEAKDKNEKLVLKLESNLENLGKRLFLPYLEDSELSGDLSKKVRKRL